MCMIEQFSVEQLEDTLMGGIEWKVMDFCWHEVLRTNREQYEVCSSHTPTSIKSSRAQDSRVSK